eukprot:1155402-Pelagomonas_calceolata.AAC.1
MEQPILQRVSVQAVYDFLLQHNNKLFRCRIGALQIELKNRIGMSIQQKIASKHKEDPIVKIKDAMPALDTRACNAMTQARRKPVPRAADHQLQHHSQLARVRLTGI